MAEKKQIMTQEGLNKLQEELERRSTVERKAIADEIEFARSYGDLSENAEYTEAKNKQSENESEIIRLQAIIRNAIVLSDDEISNEKVTVGTTVTLYDFEMEEEVTYAIVGSSEADPMNGKISNESAVGNGLLGHVSGETVEIVLPNGEKTSYEIRKIEKTV